jgi:DNA polymerase-3 subunit epsilon
MSRVNGNKLAEVMPVLKRIQALLPEKPLTFLDVESTGIYPEVDRIIELFMIRIDNPDRLHVFSSLFDPGIPIPKDSSDIHKITDEMVAGKGRFFEAYDTIEKYLDNAVLCGYNLKVFDVKILQKELNLAQHLHKDRVRIKVDNRPVIDMYTIWQLMERRTLADAYRRYCGKELTDAHTASDDVFACAEVFLAQLKAHEFPDISVIGLSEFCENVRPDAVDREGKFRWRDDDIVISFGEHRGQSIRKVPQGYLKWMLRSEFSQDTKRVIQKFLAGEAIVRPAVESKEATSST